MNLNFKRQILYDHGSAEYQEDELVYYPDKMIFGVLDGVSGLYTPDKGPKLYHSFSGAQIIGQIVRKELDSALPGTKLEVILDKANQQIKKFNQKNKININYSEKLHAVDLTLGQIKKNKMIIYQTSDSFCVWEKKNGQKGATANQAYEYDSKMMKKVENLTKKYKGSREKAWQELIPEIIKLRRKLTNKKGGFAMLNGQNEVTRYWQKVVLPIKEIKLILFLTDGMVLLKDTKNKKLMANKIIKLYKKSGLQGILNHTRNSLSKENNIYYPEATAIALNFN